MVWWVWLILAGYLLLTAFVIWQFMYWIKHARRDGHLGAFKWVIPAIVLFGICPVLGAYLTDSKVSAFFQKVGNIWIGILAALGVAMLIALITRIFVKPITRKYANGVVIAAVVFALIFNVYGMIHAKQIVIRYYQVEVSADGGAKVVKDVNNVTGDVNKPEGSTRVAFISDLHMGVNSSLNHIQDMIDTVNGSKPDIVLGGGDYFTSTYVGLSDAEIWISVLSKLAPGKCYFALGNHDVSERLFCGFAITKPEKALRTESMDAFFEAAGWKIMQDEVIDYNGIQLVFRKDGEKTGDGINKRASVKALMSKVDKTKPVIVVEHAPDDLAKLEKAGADLVLSGHTHNGQIWPGNIYGNIVAKKTNSNQYGVKQQGKLTSIVSSGIGYYGPPIRIGTNSEVVIIDVVKK